MSVAEIEFRLATRLLVPPLEGATQKYIGRTYSPEIERDLYLTVQAILDQDGYPNATLKINQIRHGNKLNIQVDVDERDPCFVASIDLPFPLPKSVKMDVSPGDICDKSKIKSAIDDLEDRIKSAGYTRVQMTYSGLQYSEDKSAAAIRITGSLGGKIEYKISDESKLFIIDDLFSSDEVAGLDPSIVSPEAMTAELSKRYRNRGYVDAIVNQPNVTKRPDDSLLYTYAVRPGQKYVLSNVIFEGVTVFEQGELLETMNLERFWGSNPPLNLDEIASGVDALKARYQEIGYWDVVIREPRIAKDEARGQATMIISISEGQQRILAGVEFRGSLQFRTSDFADKLQIQPDGPIDRGKLLAFEQQVKEAYLDQGYLYVKTRISLETRPERTRVPVNVIMEITEGPRVRVGAIQVVGLNKTQPQVVERELTFKTGDWYRPTAINSSRKTLVDLGIFRSVQISPADRGAVFEKSSELDIIVEVREGKAGTVVFGPGYDIERGFSYAAETSYTNLWGTGRQISIRGAISQEEKQRAIDNRTLIGRKIGAGYVEPHLLGLPVDGKVSVSHKATADEFWKFSQAGEVSLNYKIREITNGGNAAVFYGQKFNREEGNEAQEQFGVTTGNIRIGRVGLRLDGDFRDSQAWPTAGSLLFSEFSWARYPLGGDLRYFRWEVTNNYYFGITSNIVIAIGASAAAFHGVEKQNDPHGVLPASERMNAGGSDLVRGFALQLGPYLKRPVYAADSGQFLGYERDPIGGDRRVVIKNELRYRVSQMFGTSLFLDNGNAFLSEEQMEKFESRQLESRTAGASTGGSASIEENIGYNLDEVLIKPGYVLSRHYFSYGVAANILSPIGAINFGYAWPLKEPKSADCQADGSQCLTRAKSGKQMYYRGKFELSVGAKF